MAIRGRSCLPFTFEALAHAGASDDTTSLEPRHARAFEALAHARASDDTTSLEPRHARAFEALAHARANDYARS